MALVRAPDMGVLYEEFVGMHFKMRNFRNDIVHCSVSTEALQDKAASHDMDQNDFAHIFETFHAEIEAIATRQYEAGERVPRVTSAELLTPVLI